MHKQDSNLLELIPTKRTDEFRVRLNTPFKPLIIGTLRTSGEGEFFSRKNEKLHLHRNSNSLAINAALLFHPDWKFKWVRFDFERMDGTVEKLVTTRSYFQTFGKHFCFKKAEPQAGLELSLWGKERALRWEEERSSQGELFVEAA